MSRTVEERLTQALAPLLWIRDQPSVTASWSDAEPRVQQQYLQGARPLAQAALGVIGGEKT